MHRSRGHWRAIWMAVALLCAHDAAAQENFDPAVHARVHGRPGLLLPADRTTRYRHRLERLSRLDQPAIGSDLLRDAADVRRRPDRQYALHRNRDGRPHLLPDLFRPAIGHGGIEGRYELTSPGFRPFVEVGFASRGDRVGFEIDQRARHTQTTAIVGADVDVSPMTALTAWVGRSATSYDEHQQYASFMLADQLNHSRDTAAAGARFRVTPLTTVLMAAEFERDRFELAPLRNADSFRVGPAIALDTGAALTGDVKGGFRGIHAELPGLPSFRGFVGTARLHYALPDVVKLDSKRIAIWRTGMTPSSRTTWSRAARLTAAQRVFGPLELLGIAERREIRNQRIGGMAFDGRREVTTSLGGGFGFRFRTRCGFPFIFEHTERTSTEPVGRDYERTRVRRLDQLRTLTVKTSPPARPRDRGRSGILEKGACQLRRRPRRRSCGHVFNEPQLSGRFRVENDGQFNYPFLGR